jgi:2'-5' RNA ligase
MADRTLFFGLWPSDRQRDMMRAIINPAVSVVEGTPVDRRNWHVTLVYIGPFAEESIPALMAAVGELGPFEIRLRFDRISFWPRSKIATVSPRNSPVELGTLVTSIEDKLKPFGFVRNERTYRPHITVARNARSFPEEPLARPIDLQWDSFELIESMPVVRGEQYRPLKQ